MNWDIVLHVFLSIYVPTGIVLLSFFLPKSLIKYSRIDKREPAKIFEKVGVYLCCLFIVFVIASFYSLRGKFKFDENVLASFLCFIIPTLVSVSIAFSNDRKMSFEERVKYKREDKEFKQKHSLPE